MNERYLFRGKRTDLERWALGKWVEGHYISVPRHMIVLQEGGRWNCYDIDPATVGLCTGLRDKNGTLIFEGDIIESVLDDDDCEPEIYQITFKDFKWMMENPMFDPQDLAGFTGNGETLEIIGNIYDNPELINASESYTKRKDVTQAR